MHRRPLQDVLRDIEGMGTAVLFLDSNFTEVFPPDSELFRGLAEPGESILPPDHWAGADLDAPPHDPQRARRLLAEAGYGPARPLRLGYKT